ncbi:MAG TPA: chemotaxis protein CheW [candidate division Zixibacteria bacterium]|nr:chemotaxis protein CheW [candidate division Zixibacteria bacterium]
MSSWQYVTFGIGSLVFAVDILLVKEINRRLLLTTVYGVPPGVIGTANLRGQVLTVFDPGVLMQLPPRNTSSDRTIAVFKTDKELHIYKSGSGFEDHTSLDRVGFIFDAVGDVFNVEESAIKAVPANIPVCIADHLRGVVKEDSNLLLILNVGSLLESISLPGLSVETL